jgi:cystathionine beta-lyase
MKFNTKAIHGGQHPDPSTAVMPPISNNDLCTNKPWTSYGEYEYRNCKPHTNSFRKCIGEYREWRKRTGLSSGLAATDCLMRDWNQVMKLYGWFVWGNLQIVYEIYKDSGILFHFVDMNDMEKFKSLINENTKLVWVETPTNRWWN